METLLLQRFSFIRPIQIVPVDKGKEVIPLHDKTIIKADNESLENDFAEILATAKLAELDPLLVQFTFQKKITSKEATWLHTFMHLCQPLKSAWIWKTMRKYVIDEYMTKIEGMKALWNSFYEDVYADTIHNPGPIQKWDFLTMATILYENPFNKTDFSISSRMAQEEWDAYVDKIKEASRMEPDPKIYLALPDTTEVPFTVGIKEQNGFRHYMLRLFY
jgi:hypothetical protein